MASQEVILGEPSRVVPAWMQGSSPQEAKLSHPYVMDPGIHAGTTVCCNAGAAKCP